MKKTTNINLAGYPFVIDEDAYQLLKDYLDTIRYAFVSDDDTGEIAADIESRIAEILLEKENGSVRIVTFDEISKVISRIGKPSDFIEVKESVATDETVHAPEAGGKENVEEVITEEEKITPPPYDPDRYSRNPFVRKRLYRDPQNSMLGGVCSGLAKYLHIDPTVVRLITVLLFFLSASTVAIVYIILWIVVPEARTPLQRMQMNGEDPTVENIGKTVRENYQDNENQNSAVLQNGQSGFLHSLFSIFVKCLIILGLIIACPLLLAMAIGLVGCIIAVFVLGVVIVGGASNSFWVFSSATEEVLAFYILLAVIGGIITVGIPLWLLIRKVWKKKETDINPANSRAVLIVWLCGIALLAVFCVKSVRKGKQLHYKDMAVKIERLQQPADLSIEEEETISIEEIKETNETSDSILTAEVATDSISNN